MEMKILTDDLAKEVLLDLIETCERIDIAVAWAGKNELVDSLITNQRKLRHVVIGTHLYQTSPAVLKQLSKAHRVRCMPPDGALFHPKIYLFQTGTKFSALVGSHNLTRSAFDGPHIEAGVLIEGNTQTAPLSDLARYVKKAWERACAISDGAFLFSYEKQYEANKAKIDALRAFHRVPMPRTEAKKPSPLAVTWANFERQVRADKHHSIRERLRVLERAARLFLSNSSFAAMKDNERRAIAETFGRIEEGFEGLPWGWFGSMFGQGDFRNLVNTNPGILSAALEQDSAGRSRRERLVRCVHGTLPAAFKGKAHVGGVATASRLLAMKRPDIFVGVNNANRQGLCNAFGVAYSTLDMSNYWERIIIPIQLSPWWSANRPRRSEAGRIWDNRAALPDCIYYDPI